MEFPDGKGFGEWGPMWGYHFDEKGQWIKGMVEKGGILVGQHGGRDILCPKGTVLVSPVDGKIMRAGWQDPANTKRGYGLSVMIYLEQHKGMILTGGHFSLLFVVDDEKIRRGTRIGLSGDTGNAAGAHSHWQLEKDGPYPRSPLNFNWALS